MRASRGCRLVAHVQTDRQDLQSSPGRPNRTRQLSVLSDGVKASEIVRPMGMEMRITGSVKKLRWDAAVGLVLLGLLPAGCNRPAVRDAGQADGPAAAYLLKEEPPGARGVLDIRAELEGREKPDEAASVVLVARVGGVEGYTWDPNRAAFTVQDLPAAEHAESEETPQHDAEDCPFCRAKKKSCWRARPWYKSWTRKAPCQPWTQGNCWAWKRARPSSCAAKPRSTAWAIWPFALPGSMCGRLPREVRRKDVSRNSFVGRNSPA